MTVQHLQYILEVSRTHSISQAAKNLYVAQSSVSNAITALEGELGFQIFTRTWQGAIPTERGTQVLIYARRIVEQHQLMLGQNASKDRRDVTIATSLYLPFDEAFRQLAEENRDRTDITFNQVSFTDRLTSIQKLANFDVDVVVGTRLHPHQRKPSLENENPDLHTTIHRILPVVVRIGPGHPLYHKPDLAPEDLNGYPIIDSPSLAASTSGLLRGHIDVDPDRVLCSPHRDTRYAMIVQGLGYNFGPPLPEHINSRYQFRTIPLPGMDYYIVSTVNTARPLRPEVRRYLELVEQNLPNN